MKYEYEFRRISGMNAMPKWAANRAAGSAFSKAREEYGKAPYSVEKIWSNEQINRVNSLLKRGW